MLRDGAVVAGMAVPGWREVAMARVGDREWVYAKSRGVLTARRTVDPEHVVRFSARQASFWRSAWTLDLEGRQIDVEKASMWKPTHRFLAGGRRIAESGTTGGWSPRPTLTVDDDGLSLDQQVFLLWFEVVLDRRNRAAIGAATSAAVIGGSS